MDTKKLSSRQVCLIPKLLRYHFWIDYQKDKGSKIVGALSQYFQRSAEEEETVRVENTKIPYRLQFLLAQNLGLSILRLNNVPFPLYQALIYRTTVLPQLRLFWDTTQGKLTHKDSYTISIRGMRMRLVKLQDDNQEAKKLRSKGLPESWEDIEEVFYYQSLSYVPKKICLELINRYHNNLFAGHFGIEKNRKLIARKYYWPTL